MLNNHATDRRLITLVSREVPDRRVQTGTAFVAGKTGKSMGQEAHWKRSSKSADRYYSLDSYGLPYLSPFLSHRAMHEEAGEKNHCRPAKE